MVTVKQEILISIIISTYNDEDTIEDCLKTLTSLEYPNYEIILVNDGSTDNTLDVAKRVMENRPKVKLISYEKNRGTPAARNIGIENARGTIYVFSDSDCTFEKDWLAKLTKPLLDREDAGCSGGPDLAPEGESLLRKCIDYSMRSLIATGRIRLGDSRLARYSPASCNMAVKREVIERVGIFNEQMNNRGYEKELEHRIRKAGYRIVYVKDALVWHRRRLSLKAFWKQTFLSGKARVDILKFAPGALEPAHIFPALFSAFMILGGLFSFYFPLLRIIWLCILGVYLFTLLIDSIYGFVKIGNIKSFFILPITTMTIHFAYGLGTIFRLIGSFKIKKTPSLS